jgi:NHLM bacteriocin system ABC transporter peptidase/ATP-binding protein
MEFFGQRYAGEVSNRVGLNDQVANLLTGQLATTVLSLVSVVFYAALMFSYNVPLTVIGIFIAALNMVVLRVVSRRRVDGNRRMLQQNGKMVATAMGGLQIIETLKASGSESDFFAKWAGYMANVFNTTRDLNAYNRLLGFVGPLLSSLNTVSILGLGGYAVMRGELTVGSLVAFQSLMASFTAPFNDIVTLGSRLQEIDGSMQRLDDVLRYQVDPTVTSTSSEPARKLSGALQLEDITFGYNRLQAPLIHGFSLGLRPGSRVALVGGSGSGKSTVSRIVAGLYKPWEGEVIIDGRPRREIARASITASVALVDQDVFLFEGTVRDNITLWDRTIPPVQIQQAARDACIHDDIAARPGGYDSRVEEGGSNFSGGQRQRLEIARALVGNPTLLILDEATSALDTITEKTIDDNLRRRGCTCVIVAHRLSTIRDCDEIIVLDRGQVVQRGTHDHLVEVEGHYRRLIQATDTVGAR